MANATGKKPLYKRWWFWAVGGFFFITLLGLLNPSQAPQEVSTIPTTDKVVEANTEANEAEEPVKEEPAPAPVAVVEPVAAEPSTLDRLWTAVDASLKTREGVDVSHFPDEDGSVILYHQVDDFWDDNALVRKAYADLVYFGQEAFKLDGIPEVTVIVRAKFTDQYGKSEYADAVRVGMKKEEFQKYDWTTLRYTPIWQQMKASASPYYVHPGMIADLNMDKLYLE